MQTKYLTTVTMRFALADWNMPGSVALAHAPGSSEYAASARDARRRNAERGLGAIIPGSDSTADIDSWPAVAWRQVPDPVPVLSSCHVEVCLVAEVTELVATWLADHLDLDPLEADAGTGATVWTWPGSAWADGCGRTPFAAGQVELL